jgi:hypothetical protein
MPHYIVETLEACIQLTKQSPSNTSDAYKSMRTVLNWVEAQPQNTWDKMKDNEKQRLTNKKEYLAKQLSKIEFAPPAPPTYTQKLLFEAPSKGGRWDF